MQEKSNAISEREIDIVKLFRAYLRHIGVIILCGGGSALLIACYLLAFSPNLYTASAIMYVYTNNPNQINYQYTDQMALNTATRLMETYMVLIKSNKVMDAVSARLEYQYDAHFIANCIQVGSVSGTEVMRISATTADPQLSMDICNAVAEFAPPEIIRVVNAGMVEVIDYANLPLAPDSKNLFGNVLVAGSAGAVLACAMITILFLRDRRVRIDTDLSEYFPYPTLASFPNPKRRRNPDRKKRKPQVIRAIEAAPIKGKLRQYIITEDTPSSIVEIYKLFRTSISMAMRGAEKNVLLITSAIPSEGKSTISANLAIVSAQDNRRILLIDADMRKPIQYKLFGLEFGAKGLSDLLTGRCSFAQAVKRNVRPDLDLLRAGSLPPNPAELLNSPAMQNLMKKLRGEYDWIILDTPPMNVVADVLVLAGQADGMVLVARRNVSNLNEISDAIEKAKQIEIPIFGFALTDARGKQVKQHYRHFSYYNEYGIGYQGNLRNYTPATMDGDGVKLAEYSRRKRSLGE